MERFPETAEEFYARRDDRTNRCTNGRDYQMAHSIVTMDANLAETFTGQVMLLESEHSVNSDR